ncbi:hypothetical protein [Streptomyces sviceus]|uniref:hypothetical protein n=1 Tax=Streptomyces sviceus TaxID=285530 RepID=UPI0036EB0579
MVFGNIFGFARESAGLFSVKAGNDESDARVDFEDATEGAYDDKSDALFTHAIHGASSRAKVVREQSPEARVILGFLGSFIDTTKASAGTQSESDHAGSVSTAASGGMTEAKKTVKKEEGLQKNDKLQDKPDRDSYAKAPKGPEAPKAAEPPKAPQATAETPHKLGETKTMETTTEEPSGPQ